LADRFTPISGYQGHIRRIAADNIYGMTYKKTLPARDKSLADLKRWDQRSIQLSRLTQGKSLRRSNSVSVRSMASSQKLPSVKGKMKF
jgi:hypothetical protein